MPAFGCSPTNLDVQTTLSVDPINLMHDGWILALHYFRQSEIPLSVLCGTLQLSCKMGGEKHVMDGDQGVMAFVSCFAPWFSELCTTSCQWTMCTVVHRQRLCLNNKGRQLFLQRVGGFPVAQ